MNDVLLCAMGLVICLFACFLHWKASKNTINSRLNEARTGRAINTKGACLLIFLIALYTLGLTSLFASALITEFWFVEGIDLLAMALAIIFFHIAVIAPHLIFRSEYAQLDQIKKTTLA